MGGGWEASVVEEALRKPGGGGGFFPIGGGGPLPIRNEAEDSGLSASVRAVFRRLAMDGWKDGVVGWRTGRGERPGTGGATAPSGLGAEKDGGLGADLDDSGSDRYDEARSAVDGLVSWGRAAMQNVADVTSRVNAAACFPQLRHSTGK